MNKSNAQIFIQKSKEIHDNKYDYSKVEYINNHTKVSIICPTHGEFFMTPNAHLCGQGCPKCGHLKKGQFRKLTKEQFIQKSKKRHGDKYDYSKVEYINSQTKVCIICPEHGEFWQEPNAHLNGHKCPKCCKNGVKYTNEDFIKKSVNFHGNKYDYSKVNYVNRDTKVCIICPEHGEFWQTPHEHMHGCGCPKCASPNLNITKDEFIEKAKSVHGDKYDYSEIEIHSMHRKIGIICPEHGKFWQTPSSHLSGQGCPICKESRLEKICRILFTDYNIDFIQQINKNTFPWLGRQSLDFYIPEYNVAIECQGKQHFLPNCSFGSKKTGESLDIIKERDEKKKKLCQENGVNLIYFSNLSIEYPYPVITRKNELIKSILQFKKH